MERGRALTLIGRELTKFLRELEAWTGAGHSKPSGLSQAPASQDAPSGQQVPNRDGLRLQQHGTDTRWTDPKARV
jgi:hypothetical protein